jgi:hypothetical protein
MAVNNPDKEFYNIGPWWQTNTPVIYRSILTLELVGLKLPWEFTRGIVL